MILAGDIGGTNSRLALFDDSLNKCHEQTYRNEGRSSLTDVVREFLGSTHQSCTDGASGVDRATFGVAGPVKDGVATMTNLPWKLDASALARELAIPHVALINDLVAHAEGIELLKPDQIITIHAGDEAPGKTIEGNRAIIAAGTGLGEAGIFWDTRARSYRAFPSEGGHCDFAPRDHRQIALLRYLRGRYPNASWERLLSGPGLRNIYDFLITSDQLGPSAALSNHDPKPADITAAARQNQSKACVEAVDLFISAYGAESANLALKMLAIGGLYIGGGIAPQMIDKLKSPTFLESFFATGPENIRAVLRRIPIRLINFDLNGLYGAANYASKL